MDVTLQSALGAPQATPETRAASPTPKNSQPGEFARRLQSKSEHPSKSSKDEESAPAQQAKPPAENASESKHEVETEPPLEVEQPAQNSFAEEDHVREEAEVFVLNSSPEPLVELPELEPTPQIEVPIETKSETPERTQFLDDSVVSASEADIASHGDIASARLSEETNVTNATTGADQPQQPESISKDSPIQSDDTHVTLAQTEIAIEPPEIEGKKPEPLSPQIDLEEDSTLEQHRTVPRDEEADGLSQETVLKPAAPNHDSNSGREQNTGGGFSPVNSELTTKTTISHSRPVKPVPSQVLPPTTTEAAIDPQPSHSVESTGESSEPVRNTVPTASPVTERSPQPPTSQTIAPEKSPHIDPALNARVEQIQGAIRSSLNQGRSMRMRMHPPELGVLQIELKSTDGVLTARLEVENQAAYRSVLESLPALQETLNRQGSSVERIEVTFMDTHADDNSANKQFQQKDQDSESNASQQNHEERETNEVGIGSRKKQERSDSDNRLGLRTGLDIQV